MTTLISKTTQTGKALMGEHNSGEFVATVDGEVEDRDLQFAREFCNPRREPEEGVVDSQRVANLDRRHGRRN